MENLLNAIRNLLGTKTISYYKDANGQWIEGTPTPTPVPPSPTATPSPASAGFIQGFRTWRPPSTISNSINSVSRQYNLHPALVAALLQQESGIDPRVKDNVSFDEQGRKSRDRGPAQISDIWHPEITDEQAYDPDFAIQFVAKQLANAYAKYNSWPQAIASYNVGGRVGPSPGRDQYGLGPKGQQYVNSVIKNIEPSVLKELGLLSQY